MAWQGIPFPLNGSIGLLIEKIPHLDVTTKSGFGWDTIAASVAGAIIASAIPAGIAWWSIRNNNRTMREDRERQFHDFEESRKTQITIADEGRKAFLHRFAVAGAAIRYRDTHRSEVEDIVALDIALRRNDREWVEQLPAEMEQQIIHKLYYGHFLCHVFHQDYIVKKGVDPLAMEHAMWHLLDDRGAEYPAEHNVGHLYVAKPALKQHYQKLDPNNQFNVGIGHTSKLKGWK